MLTILYDKNDQGPTTMEVASACGRKVVRRKNAVRILAKELIEQGYDATTPMRVVVADPYSAPPPHYVANCTLDLAARIDFFGDPDGPKTQKIKTIESARFSQR